MTVGTGINPPDAVDPLVLAIDVGTSSTRALVYDGRGRSVNTWEVHRPYALTVTSNGGVEIDPRALCDLTCQCVDQILQLLGANSGRVRVVATDTFWHSLLGVDAEGNPVTPVYTWADTRSSGAARELKQRLDERAVHARTGAVLHSTYLPAKLLWLSESGDTDKVAYWMSFPEYFYLQLFGERRVSYSMASGTGLLNQNTCGWDEEVITALPIREAQLSPLAEFSDAMKGLRSPFAERWPTLKDVPWNLSLGDGACNNIGSGGFCADWIVVMIGTSGALRVVQDVDRVTIPWGLWTYRVDRRRIVQGGALSAGGNIFAWLSHVLRVDPVDALEQELLDMLPDAHGLTILPFLAGERSPDWDLDARAAFIGMRLDTTALDLARACLESIAYRFGIIYDILKGVIRQPSGVIGSGAGLLHSPAWMQILTDVLGTPMVASGVQEATSRGGAILALQALGTLEHLGDAPAPLGDRYEPIDQHHQIYRSAMDRQRELYERLLGHRDEPGAPHGNAVGALTAQKREEKG